MSEEDKKNELQENNDESETVQQNKKNKALFDA